MTDPYHSQSNGLAEKYVGIDKRTLSKSMCDDQDPMTGILEYRATPLEFGYSPAQLLMGRQLRSVISTIKENVTPKIPDHDYVKQFLSEQKQKDKRLYDKKAKTLQPIQVGDSLRIRLGKLWKPATCIAKHSERSFTVQTPDGGEYRRKRVHLLKTNETPQTPLISDDDLEILQDSFTRDNSPTVENNVNIPGTSLDNAPESPELDISSSTSTKPYITRSGRVIKPKIIVSV
ncbi:uncharacterized protein LOC128234361 [Mya arenaria]|uniref:uncharacterized protein LOC128234361 n=1 Tax=Mya arenaria TaxID=6604 RepID=UPI0022E43748|nr:uncharacterized protein LOC128234361 [Mya arenaria]